MGGKPCIPGMRVTVGMIVGMLATGHDKAGVLELYPYLEPAAIDQALSYAAWRVDGFADLVETSRPTSLVIAGAKSMSPPPPPPPPHTQDARSAQTTGVQLGAKCIPRGTRLS
jgi:uncharacterized protein (DUF433 family)